MLAKRKSHAFGKDIYLVGENTEGKLVWLEAPKWDCGWYWAFGYIETYTNNQFPERAKDIENHSHWKGFLGEVKTFNHQKMCYEIIKYKHHINESPLLKRTVLTEKESWKISDYMKSFYTLKEAAEVLGRGDSHYTTDPAKTCQNTAMAKEINEVILPKLFQEVLKLLTPEEE